MFFLSDHRHAYIRKKERTYLLLTSLLFLLFRYASGTFPDMLPSVFNITIWESDTPHLLWGCSAGREFVIAPHRQFWLDADGWLREEGCHGLFGHCISAWGKTMAVCALHSLG